MHALRTFWHHVQTMRLPLLMCVVTAGLLILPPQTQEIYRALSQIAAFTDWSDPSDYHRVLPEFYFTVAGIVIVSLALWFMARRVASIAQWEAASADVHRPSFENRPPPFLWIPRFVVMAAPLSVATGIMLAKVQPDFIGKVKAAMVSVFKLQVMQDGIPEDFAELTAIDAADRFLTFTTYLTYFANGLLSLAIVLFLLVTLLDRPALARLLAQPRPWFRIPLTLVVIAVFVAVLTSVLLSPVALPQKVGPIFIMCFFLFMLQLVLYQLLLWQRQTGFPFSLILVLFAILFSVLDWNDNHSIHSLTAKKPVTQKHETISASFKRWMASRIDLDQYAGKPYPIYIVAAQGGGIYAAKHASSFLSELQDLCPGFSHHLFAISGVSGGSAGASVFASLTRDRDWTKVSKAAKLGCVADLKAQRDVAFTEAITEIFDQDLWSPLSASLLYPDFLQRFLFFPVDSWDRARAWDLALENAYGKGIRTIKFLPEGQTSVKPLSSPYLDHWDPEKNSHTPALLLNTTEVGTGKRLLVSPFSFSGAGLRFLPVWATRKDGKPDPFHLNPPLSTAAGLSARFPWITPAAYFYEAAPGDPTGTKKRKTRVVDGAYFDNSGVVTAIDLIKNMVAYTSKGEITQKIEINLIVFTSAEFESGGDALGLGEAMDPIRTMFNTRAARSGIAVNEALETMAGVSTAQSNVTADIIELQLNGYGYPLPLGWRLSPVTRHLISYHNGSELLCSAAEASKTTTAVTSNTASCAKRLIYERLK